MYIRKSQPRFNLYFILKWPGTMRMMCVLFYPVNSQSISSRLVWTVPMWLVLNFFPGKSSGKDTGSSQTRISVSVTHPPHPFNIPSCCFSRPCQSGDHSPAFRRIYLAQKYWQRSRKRCDDERDNVCLHLVFPHLASAPSIFEAGTLNHGLGLEDSEKNEK